MQSTKDAIRAESTAHLRANGRRLGRFGLASALLATAVGATACGEASQSPTRILNTERVERAIEKSSLAQRGQQAQVSCPSGVHQKKGLVFSCTAVVKGASTKFTVTEVDSAGNVRYVAR